MILKKRIGFLQKYIESQKAINININHVHQAYMNIIINIINAKIHVEHQKCSFWTNLVRSVRIERKENACRLEI